MKKYKKICFDILEGRKKKILAEYKADYHESIKYHLQLSIRAA
jgi:hypothetical protein